MLKSRCMFRQYHLFERMPDGSVWETKRQLMGFTLIVRPIIKGHRFDNRRGYIVYTTQYEIFMNSRHGAAVSITTVETLGQAEQTLHALAWLEPGDYFARDCTTGEIVAGRSKDQSAAGS